MNTTLTSIEQSFHSSVKENISFFIYNVRINLYMKKYNDSYIWTSNLKVASLFNSKQDVIEWIKNMSLYDYGNTMLSNKKELKIFKLKVISIFQIFDDEPDFEKRNEIIINSMY